MSRPIRCEMCNREINLINSAELTELACAQLQLDRSEEDRTYTFGRRLCIGCASRAIAAYSNDIAVLNSDEEPS